jgi:hypothetical protein
VKEKYFKSQYRPAGILLNVDATIYFQVKLQLKSGIKNYSSTFVNFHAGLHQKITVI